MPARAEDGIVASIDRARQLLAEVRDPGSAKRVADLARAAEIYGKRQRLSEEVIGHATAIRVDALTRLGEMLLAMPKNGGARGIGKSAVPNGDHTPAKLADIGISKKESAAAQKLADLKAKAPALHEQVRTSKTTAAKATVEVRRQAKRADLEAKATAAAPTSDAWRVITGDAVAELRKVADRPRLIFADPPYNVGVDYGGGAEADLVPGAEFVAWVESWVRLGHAALTPDGSFWFLISDEYAAECCLVLKRYFTLRNWLIWHETFGVNCSNKFNRTTRHLFYCVKDPARFVFNAEAVTRPSARQVVYNDGRATNAGKLWDSLWTIPRLVGTAAERIPDFPTQLPLELLTPIICCATDPGDLVLDPFNGSGTTGAAAVANGRRYVGIEKSAKFADLARLRLTGVRDRR